MARESCDLDNKEEAELLKPPTSSSSSTSPSHPQSSAPPSTTAALFMNPIQEFTAKKAEKKDKLLEQAKSTSSVRFATNRCSSCRKKVGLTGFRCRCGDLFCGQHRYSDTHDCSFDYKALGREQISKANPVIRAAKIIKI